MLKLINKLRHYRWVILGRKKIKAKINNAHKNKLTIKIVLGASHILAEEEGWINTDLPHFDITKEGDWLKIMGANKADNFLAEHVFEHLTLQQNKIVIGLIYKYLKPKGTLRFAVPDGYHSDENYINYVKPNGIGPGCDDHKLLWTIDLIMETFGNSNFEIIPREYYNKEGILFSSQLSLNSGFIHRTVTNPNKQNWELNNYSSLIVDFIKNK